MLIRDNSVSETFVPQDDFQRRHYVVVLQNDLSIQKSDIRGGRGGKGYFLSQSEERVGRPSHHMLD